MSDTTENKADVVHQGSCGCQSGTCAEKHEVEEVRETARTYLPAVDIIENETETMLLADMPGVAAGGVDITIEKDVLTIKGTPPEANFEGKTLAYSEYGIGGYERAFTLSDGLDKENISASLVDGVLKLRIPKLAPVSKKITVAAV